MNIYNGVLSNSNAFTQTRLPPLIPGNPPDTRPRLQPRLPKAIIIRIHRPPSSPPAMMAVTVATPREQRVRAGAMPAVAPAA